MDLVPRSPDLPRVAVTAVSVVRTALGVCVLAVLGYTYVVGISIDGANPFNYFGYFTNLTCLLTALLAVALGAGGIAGRRPTPAMDATRAALVASMLVVGVIYNTLIPGTGTAPPWVSTMLHVVFPAAVLVDWAFVGDRGPLPWRRLWLALPYPLLWLTVVLIRGVTDGWVPYGFLLPSHGLGWILGHVAALLAALLAAAALVWALSRCGGMSFFLADPRTLDPESDTAEPVSTVPDHQDLLK